jgi:hypothetical protein
MDGEQRPETLQFEYKEWSYICHMLRTLTADPPNLDPGRCSVKLHTKRNLKYWEYGHFNPKKLNHNSITNTY